MATPTIDAANAAVGDYIAGFTNSLSGAASALTESIFDTPDILFGLVDKGKLWAPGTDFDTTSWDISQTMQKLIFANTLPAVWCKSLGRRQRALSNLPSRTLRPTF